MRSCDCNGCLACRAAFSTLITAYSIATHKTPSKLTSAAHRRRSGRASHAALQTLAGTLGGDCGIPMHPKKLDKFGSTRFGPDYPYPITATLMLPSSPLLPSRRMTVLAQEMATQVAG